MNDSTNAPTDTKPTGAAERGPPTPQQEQDTRASQLIEGESVRKRERNRVISVIGLQVFILLCMLLLSLVAAMVHGHDWPIPSEEDFANFDFIGVGADNPEPSFIAVAIEVLAWSALGVLARSEYYVTRLIFKHEDFMTLEIVSKLIGDFAMGVSVAVAVVALLRSTEFVTLSLKTAGIDIVAAISFILGFYHEDTRRLLGIFRERVAKSASEQAKDE